VAELSLARGSWRLVAVPVVLAPGLAVVSRIGALGALAVALGIAWFHRDPDRSPPETGVVAPADGTISVLRSEGDRVRLGVFMNVDDVHVCRAPVGATVADRTHTPGAHRPAFSKASDRNERVDLAFDTPADRWEVRLIAGVFARRIHPYASTGDRLQRGERIGHISFGSRVDVLFPPTIDREDITVALGDTVRAGETKIASRA